MEQLRQRIVRSSGKRTDIFPLAIVVTLVVLLLGLTAQSILQITGILDLSITEEEDAVRAFASNYLVFLCIWPVTFLAIVLPKANRPMLRDILPNRRGNTLVGILLGLLGGFGLNAICVVISLYLGDIGLELSTFEPAILGMFLIAIFIQSGAEEIITRQFLYEKLRRRYRSPWVAILGNAAFFAALHLPNEGVTAIAITQCFAIGVVLSIFVCYYDSLWAAILFHTAWNYTQNIIFGCPNSGIVSAYSLFRLTAASWGPFFDPVFGVEGSMGSLALIVALGVILVVYAKVKRLPIQDLWAEDDGTEEQQDDVRPRHLAA